MESSQLPPSASNLSAGQPCTSKFYLLPKIHKPGNPARPIVSACSCPTELLAVYLDHWTAPFVRSLGSYVKETTLTLNIPDSFRFRDGDEQPLVFTNCKKSYTEWWRSLRTAILSLQERDALTIYRHSPTTGRTSTDTQHLWIEWWVLQANRWGGHG